MPVTVATKTAHQRERRRLNAYLGSNYEVTRRYRNFAKFWAENPGVARYALQVEAREILHTERVRFCLRRRVRKGESVDVLHVPMKNSAHYGNLMTCASVWNCPVCAAKITTRRRQELSDAIKIWTERGNRILLTTFTLQHKIDEPCSDVLDGLSKSYASFWRDRPGKRIRSNYRIAGRVRGLETTYTLENGWHTHIHDLWFIESKLTPNLIDQLRGQCVAHWQKVLSRHNRYADSEHGVDIRNAEQDIADYVSKYGQEDLTGIAEKAKRWDEWTEAHEVTLGPIKRGKKTKRVSFTPLQLLALSLAGDEFAGRLFKEYAESFKGKSQVRWSRGLRDMLGLKRGKTDEELATSQDETALILAQLDKDNWGVVLGNAARSELLKIASTGNSWSVLGFLEDMGIYDAKYPQLEGDENYFPEGWNWNS